jgi:hypothetical protein
MSFNLTNQYISQSFHNLVQISGSTVLVDGLGNFVYDLDTIKTGSFTGSFVGDGSGLSNVGVGSGLLTTASFNSYTGSNTSQFAGTASFASTASYALNGGVTQIVAGTNVTITNGGSGSVTINAATGSGSGSGTPGGSDTEIQFNSGSAFSGSAAFRFIYTSQSLEQGLQTTASGEYSHAEGIETQAIGEGSHAEGNATQAIGDISHAEGFATTASGSYSHAEGYTTQAIGYVSHAEGYYTLASGEYSHAEGDETLAIGEGSHAEGIQTKTGTQNAYYAQSVVSGVITLSGSYGDVTSEFSTDNRLYLYDEPFPFDNIYTRAIFIISQSYYSNPNTIVELYDTSVTTTTAYVGNINYGIYNWTGNQTIPGDYSHAEGYNTLAIGIVSHAEGDETYAIGDFSHAEGEYTQAIGNASHAEGDTTQAIGGASHAEGVGTQAIGDISHAEGYYTQTIGYASHAEGNQTQASGDFQHVQGLFNITSSVSGAFIVGNGTSNASRSNLIYAYEDTVEISGSLFISGAAQSAGNNNILTYNTTTGLVTYTASAAIGGGGGGSGTPGGSDTEIQFNSGSAFSGSAAFRFIYTSQSLEQGYQTQVIGNYSHAEGIQTRTGTQNAYYAESVVSGIVTLSSSYGDIYSEFIADNRLHLYDEPFGDIYGRATFIISQSYYSNPNTIVELYDTSVTTTTTAYVGDINYGILNWTGDQTIPGDYSHVEGWLTQAIGFASHAEGIYTQAIGVFSHAEGTNTLSIGQYSHAEGDQTQAIENYSHAEGGHTIAIGSVSHAEGYQTQAIGNASHAEGEQTLSIGYASHAEGYQTKTGTQNAYYAESVVSGSIILSSSYGDVSSEFGADNRLYLYDIPFEDTHTETYVISQSYYSNPNTIVELYDTSVTTTPAYVGDINYGIVNWTGDQTIPGEYSHAEGYNTLAIGIVSHAEGNATQAIGDISHAEGDVTQAIGDASHAEGANTTAIGEGSHAEGDQTQAIGNASHAEGYETQALGEASHAEGYQTKTGTQNAYYAQSVVSGIVTLSSSYGDVTGEFGADNRLYLYDQPFDNIYGGTYIISQSYYSNPNTIVELYYTSVTTTPAYVGDINYGIVNWTGDQTIPGFVSHAEGASTQAIGIVSHAEGKDTQAIGDASHAEGDATQAIGDASHAEGDTTQAIGNYSHAEGLGTIASGAYQHVQGLYNITSSVSGAFIVGNGIDDSNRSNLVFTSGSTFQITGSLLLNDILVLTPRTTTPPTASAGMLIVSGSGANQHIYCYLNGWTQLDN